MKTIKTLIVLSVVLPFCLAIEVKFRQTYGTAIKKVEIPSCKAEPCPLVKGVPLDIFITVESRYPKEKEFDTVSDLQSFVGIDGYRNRYVYSLAERYLYCKEPNNDCPLKFNNLYTIKRQLFLSKDDKSTQGTGFGSKNGEHYVMINVVMMAHDMVGTVIGDGNIELNFKAAP